MEIDRIPALPIDVAEIECFRRRKRLIKKLLRSMGWSYTIINHDDGNGYYLDDHFIGETQLDVIFTLSIHKYKQRGF
jgi:hypothetical protein